MHGHFTPADNTYHHSKYVMISNTEWKTNLWYNAELGYSPIMFERNIVSLFALFQQKKTE